MPTSTEELALLTPQPPTSGPTTGEATDPSVSGAAAVAAAVSDVGGGLSLPPPESENPESIPEDDALESALVPSTAAGSLPMASDEGETNKALFGGGGMMLDGSVKMNQGPFRPAGSGHEGNYEYILRYVNL